MLLFSKPMPFPADVDAAERIIRMIASTRPRADFESASASSMTTGRASYSSCWRSPDSVVPYPAACRPMPPSNGTMMSRSTVVLPHPAAPVNQRCGRQSKNPHSGARTVHPAASAAEAEFSHRRLSNSDRTPLDESTRHNLSRQPLEAGQLRIDPVTLGVGLG